jgi:Predicted permeases
MEWGYIVAGFAVGWLVGLTGVGGGSLMTPILLLFFNVKATVAVGTDLLYASLTKSVGVLAHGKLGNIDWRIVGILGLGSVPASLITTWLIGRYSLDSDAVISSIRFWLGIALLLTSLSVIFRHELMKSAHHEQHLPRPAVPVLTFLLGVVLGAMVTLTSVGAGALGVTALLLLYPTIHINRIIGSDVAHAVPLTLVAGLGHASLGTVDYGLLGTLLIGSVPGIWIGSHMTRTIDEQWVRSVLAVILVYVGQKLCLPDLPQWLGAVAVIVLMIVKAIYDSRKKLQGGTALEAE